ERVCGDALSPKYQRRPNPAPPASMIAITPPPRAAIRYAYFFIGVPPACIPATFLGGLEAVCGTRTRPTIGHLDSSRRVVERAHSGASRRYLRTIPTRGGTRAHTAADRARRLAAPIVGCPRTRGRGRGGAGPPEWRSRHRKDPSPRGIRDPGARGVGGSGRL